MHWLNLTITETIYKDSDQLWCYPQEKEEILQIKQMSVNKLEVFPSELFVRSFCLTKGDCPKSKV